MADEKVKGDVDKAKQDGQNVAKDVKAAAKDAGAAVKDAVQDEHAKADAEVKAAVADATGAAKKVVAAVAPASKSNIVRDAVIGVLIAAAVIFAAKHFGRIH